MAVNRRKEISYTKCKTWNHWMDLAPASTPTTVQYGFVLRCERCSSLRHVELDRFTGQVISSRYEYPKDYRDVGVKLTKAELRKAEMKIQRKKRRAA